MPLKQSERAAAATESLAAPTNDGTLVDRLAGVVRGAWGWVRPLLARIYHAARDIHEQAMHPSRRRAAQNRLGFSAAWERALVLCHGNICRSPYAAAVLVQAFAAHGIAIPVHQGGFYGSGRRSTATARMVAKTGGINLKGHRSRLVSPVDAHGQTLVIVMEPSHAQRVVAELGVPRNRILVLGDLDPEPIQQRPILDPWGRDAAAYEAVYRRIQRCSVALAQELAVRTVSPPARPVELAEIPPPPEESARKSERSTPSAAPGDHAMEVRFLSR